MKNVDKINMIPIVDGDGTEGEGRSGIIMDNPDFIKFRFRYIINKKFLVFRAILEAITDVIHDAGGDGLDFDIEDDDHYGSWQETDFSSLADLEY